MGRTRVIEGNAPHMIAIEDRSNVVAHLSSQGFNSPTMAQQCAMERPDTVVLEPEGRSGLVLAASSRDRRLSRLTAAVAHRLHQPVYYATEMVDGTTIYERRHHA